MNLNIRSWAPAVLLLITCAGRLLAAPKVPVILSTDIGNEIDDQWAVVYMLVNQEVYDVLGIVSAHAPSLPAPAAHRSYEVLVDLVENHLNMVDHPPLFEGSSVPLTDTETPQPNAGVSFIVNAAKRFSSTNRLTILTIGAATDVASAILLDPGITGRIRVVAMGFTKWPEGGNEYNVANDVKAWQVILNSDVPVVIGSGAVCRAHLALGFEQARNMIRPHGPVGAWLWSEFETWYYRHVKPLRKDDFSKPWIIWDTIVLAYVEGLTQQETYARPALTDEMQFAPGRKDRTVTWITSVDSARMWDDFLQKLDAYQRTMRYDEAPHPKRGRPKRLPHRAASAQLNPRKSRQECRLSRPGGPRHILLPEVCAGCEDSAGLYSDRPVVSPWDRPLLYMDCEPSKTRSSFHEYSDSRSGAFRPGTGGQRAAGRACAGNYPVALRPRNGVSVLAGVRREVDLGPP